MASVCEVEQTDVLTVPVPHPADLYFKQTNGETSDADLSKQTEKQASLI